MYVGDFYSLCLIFLLCRLDFLFRFVLHSCKNPPCPTLPDSLAYTHARAHTYMHEHIYKYTHTQTNHKEKVEGGKVKGHLHNGFSRII